MLVCRYNTTTREASLALYGRLFTFTHEDVDVAREGVFRAALCRGILSTICCDESTLTSKRSQLIAALESWQDMSTLDAIAGLDAPVQPMPETSTSGRLSTSPLGDGLSRSSGHDDDGDTVMTSPHEDLVLKMDAEVDSSLGSLLVKTEDVAALIGPESNGNVNCLEILPSATSLPPVQAGPAETTAPRVRDLSPAMSSQGTRRCKRLQVMLNI